VARMAYFVRAFSLLLKCLFTLTPRLGGSRQHFFFSEAP
jgi:hypothetical protein